MKEVFAEFTNKECDLRMRNEENAIFFHFFFFFSWKKYTKTGHD